MEPFKKHKYIIILLIVSFLIFTISCSTTAPNTTAAKITTTQEATTTPASTTTVAETATTQEATTTTEAIINAPEIAGLKFDQATKTYIAEAANPYGLKEGELAGVYTPNILNIETVDGTSGNFDKGIASLSQEVIKVLQAQALKEKGEYFFPLLIDVRNIDNLGLTELKMLPDEGIKSLGFKIPVGTELYSPIESSDFKLLYGKEFGINYDEATLQTSFDIKTKNLNGFFFIITMRKNFLLENKIIKETPQKTNDGKNFTLRTVQLKFGNLMGKIASEESLKSQRELKQIENKGEQQLTLWILGKNRSEYKGGLDPILKIDNTLISILPRETK